MKDEAYIVLNSRGISRMTRKTRPKLAQGEYAVKLELTVPDHVFAARPIAQATLDVSAERLLAPAVEVTQLVIPPDPPPCLNCGHSRAEHHVGQGWCLHGPAGEDATTYEPRPVGWMPPSEVKTPLSQDPDYKAGLNEG